MSKLSLSVLCRVLVVVFFSACGMGNDKNSGRDAGRSGREAARTGGQRGALDGSVQGGATGGAIPTNGGVVVTGDSGMGGSSTGGVSADGAAMDSPGTDGKATGGIRTGGTTTADASVDGPSTGDARSGGVSAGDAGGPSTGGVISTTSPTIFLASDSTVRYYPRNASLQQGWGQRLAEFLTENVKIENRALGGRAIVQFYNESLSFPQIMKEIKPGDYVFIAFGINDRSDVPDQTIFREYLKKYITETRAKQGIPVLITPTPRQQHENGVFTNAFAKYCESDLIIGKETGTPVVDLQSKGLEFFTLIGPEKVKSDMMVDTLHYKQMGAYHMARLLAEGLSETTLPLAGYVIKANLDPARVPTKDGW